MALKNYTFTFDEAGFNAFMAEVDARFHQLEKVTRITVEKNSAPQKPTYTAGTFSYNGSDYTFTKAAFHLPSYGYILADTVAGDPDAHAAILDDLIARESPILAAV
ncbi:hypothetical protein [Chondrinema litorale]|uniref:hypothetical protein n=1 Tax=Chondrinema litorale TaxID=2994555 RepID=UPI0025428014|nr:hypothetical protein [Chondrinema litorale]UZR93155.1 hypothetical protein OQ292_14945 [Chondrinema litorale]